MFLAKRAGKRGWSFGSRDQGLPATVKAKFDLNLSLQETDGRITGWRWSMPRRCLRPRTIERYLGYFAALLEGMVAEEERGGGATSDAANRAAAGLYEWNATEAKYPKDKLHPVRCSKSR